MSGRVVGILLAAGRSERFGAAKLLAPLAAGPAAGTPVGLAACRHLLAALPETVAVLRPGDDALAEMLRAAGARVVFCTLGPEGMGTSLAFGVQAAPAAAGCVVALADMPWIAPATILRVAQAIATGASIAAPVHEGRRGHPVGFAAAHRESLLALRGDEGARRLLAARAEQVQAIAVDDPGVLRDVDTPADLAPR